MNTADDQKHTSSICTSLCAVCRLHTVYCSVLFVSVPLVQIAQICADWKLWSFQTMMPHDVVTMMV